MTINRVGKQQPQELHQHHQQQQQQQLQQLGTNIIKLFCKNLQLCKLWQNFDAQSEAFNLSGHD